MICGGAFPGSLVRRILTNFAHELSQVVCNIYSKYLVNRLDIDYSRCWSVTVVAYGECISEVTSVATGRMNEPLQNPTQDLIFCLSLGIQKLIPSDSN